MSVFSPASYTHSSVPKDKLEEPPEKHEQQQPLPKQEQQQPATTADEQDTATIAPLQAKTHYIRTYSTTHACFLYLELCQQDQVLRLCKYVARNKAQRWKITSSQDGELFKISNVHSKPCCLTCVNSTLCIIPEEQLIGDHSWHYDGTFLYCDILDQHLYVTVNGNSDSAEYLVPILKQQNLAQQVSSDDMCTWQVVPKQHVIKENSKMVIVESYFEDEKTPDLPVTTAVPAVETVTNQQQQPLLSPRGNTTTTVTTNNNTTTTTPTPTPTTPTQATTPPKEKKESFEGYVEIKEDGLFKSNKKRFLQIKQGILKYFEKNTDKVSLFELTLEQASAKITEEGTMKQVVLKLEFVLQKKNRVLMISPLSGTDAKQIKRALVQYGVKEIKTVAIQQTGSNAANTTTTTLPQHSTPPKENATTTTTTTTNQQDTAVKTKGGIWNAFSSPTLLGKTSTRSLSRVESMDVSDWTVSDVQEWLSYIHTTDGNMLIRFGECFIENDVNGKVLMQLTDDTLKEIGVTSLGMRKRLIKEIDKLRQTGHFNLNEHLVFSKVKNMDPKYLKSIPDMEDMVKSLCNKTQILNTYLDTKRFSSEQIKAWIDQSKTEKDEDFDIIPDQEYRQYEELKVRVKLVVTEIVHTDKEKQLRKILSPVIARIPTLHSEFGLFHTAIVVGPWYLEWTDSALCIPKKICSSMALLSADVDNIIVQKDKLGDLAEKIADVVVEWNINNHYVNMKTSTKGSNEGNCQDFVDAVLDKLGIKPVFAGALGNFLEQMRTSGTCNLEFTPDKEFREKFELTEKSYKFNAHAEIDTFTTQLKQKCQTFKIDYPSEWGLLKSFDRAFWLRHFKDSENPKFTPLGGPCNPTSNITVTKCPMGNPIVTHSYF